MDEVIHRLQEEFDQAELHADIERLERLIADDFLSIGPKGFVLTKAEWIGHHIRRYGSTAIVRNVQRSRATYQDQEMTLTVRVSQVWVQQPDDAWRLVAIQFSPMASE